MATNGSNVSSPDYYPYTDSNHEDSTINLVAGRPSPQPGPSQAPPDYPGVGNDVIGSVETGVPREGEEGREGEFHRRLSTDSRSSSASSVDENLSVASITSSIEDRLTWRGRMQVVLHNHIFHWFVIFLVILDAFIVLFELLLDLGAFSNVECRGEGVIEQAEFCHYSPLFRDECGPPAIVLLERTNISAPPPHNGGPGLGDEICVCEFRHGKRVCLSDEEGAGVNPALILHVASLLILSTFMIEIGLKIIAFRLKFFLPAVRVVKIRNRIEFKYYFISFEVFDAIVVVISWILDIASLQEEEAFELFDLIIILRLWRIVRVVNGTILSAKAQLDEQLHEARHHARIIIKALHKAQDKLELLEKDNKVLRKRLIQEPPSLQPTEPPEKIPPVITVETVDPEVREE